MNMNLLTERARDIQNIERCLLTYQNKKEELRAELWINTDFATELEKPKPTEKDKDAYVRSNKEYKELNENITKCKSKLDYEIRMFDICFNEKYNRQ